MKDRWADLSQNAGKDLAQAAQSDLGGLNATRLKFHPSRYLRTFAFSKRLLGEQLAQEIEQVWNGGTGNQGPISPSVQSVSSRLLFFEGSLAACVSEADDGVEPFKFVYETAAGQLRSIASKETAPPANTAALCALEDLRTRRRLCAYPPTWDEFGVCEVAWIGFGLALVYVHATRCCRKLNFFIATRHSGS